MMQWLPELFAEVVTKVSAVTNAGADPFPVFFDYGHYNEVVKNLNIKKGSISSKANRYPLIWLIMDFEERKGKTLGVYAELNANLLIAVPTNTNYTMGQRKEKVFLPRLYPIYEQLLRQISKSPAFRMPPIDRIEHTKIDRPYWGGQDRMGMGDANLFEDFIDAVQIKNMKLFVRK